MPKTKRKKNIFGFGRKSSGNYIPASGGIAKHAPKHRAKAKTEAADSTLDEVARSLAGKPYSKLSSSQQATVRSVASKMNPRRKRKRNASLGLPSNQFVNAKVRMKGGKIQVMADERVLGRAGFKGGVALNPKRRRNFYPFDNKDDRPTYTPGKKGPKTYYFKGPGFNAKYEAKSLGEAKRKLFRDYPIAKTGTGTVDWSVANPARRKNIFGLGWSKDSITKGKKTHKYKKRKYRGHYIYKWGPDDYGTSAERTATKRFRSVADVKDYIDRQFPK